MRNENVQKIKINGMTVVVERKKMMEAMNLTRTLCNNMIIASAFREYGQSTNSKNTNEKQKVISRA